MPYHYLQIFSISLALLRGIVVCCGLSWIHIDFLRKYFQEIRIFGWTCFFHTTLTKRVKYLQAYNYLSSLFPFLIDRHNVCCFKAWWKQGRFCSTIHTYTYKKSLNMSELFLIILVEKPYYYLSHGFLFEFPLFWVFSNKKHLHLWIYFE